MPKRQIAFDAGPGARGNIISENITYFDKSQSVITLHPYTVTLVTVTSPVGFVGNRPAILPAGMGAATDGGNYCIGTAAIRPQASQTIEMIGTVYSATFADPKFHMGFGVVTTTGVANLIGGTDFTDYIGMYKTTGGTNLKFHARKASGTAEDVAISFTGADATWLRFHMILTRDSATAGKGRVQIYGGADTLEQLPLLFDYTVATQFPDTVSLAPQFGWLSGANNTGLSFGSHGWRLYNRDTLSQ